MKYTKNKKDKHIRKIKNNKTRKIKPSKNRRRDKKQKGGILIKMPAKEAFNFFINNSQVELLTEPVIGSFGIILKLTLNPGVVSRYEMFNASTYKKPIDCILLKLVALGPNKGRWTYKDGNSKIIELEETFQKEINIQTDIFFKTMEYLEPICPAPVYANVLKNKDDSIDFLKLLETKVKNIESVDSPSPAPGIDSISMDDLLNFMKKNKPDTKLILQILQDRINSGQIPWLGLLAMELAKDYITINDYYIKCNTKKDYLRYEEIEQMAKLQILNLALKTGYSQNDFHRDNLLINSNYEGMNNLGKVMIIDFGLATKIAPDTLLEIKNLYNQKKYQEALNLFKSFVRPDSEKKLGYYQSLYGWLYNEDTEKRGKLPKRTNEYYNNIIDKLVTEENDAIDTRIKLFDEKHKENPEVYPLLPLSNSIKNNFYQGYGV
jgi:hypothetical protein